MLAALVRRRHFSAESVSDCLGTLADAALAACLALTPLALGGRHDAGQLVYVLTVAVATLATAGRAALSGRAIVFPRPVAGLGCAAAAIVAFQLTPLPSAVLEVVAPGHAGLLPAWSPESPLGPWRTVSLTPAESAEGLALLIAHGLLFLVVYARIGAKADVRRMLAAVAIAAVFASALAVAQRLAPSDRLLWLYDFPGRSFDAGVQGTFANKNHFAHFLSFGLAALGAFALAPGAGAKPGERRRTGRSAPSGVTLRGAACAGGAGVLVVLLATQSRGAIVALGAACAVALGMRWLTGRLRLAELLALVTVGVAALGGLSFFGYEAVASRFDDLVSGEVERLDREGGRRLIWAANARAFLANPWVGHGAGSHRYVYPAYVEGGSPFEFTHAESGYLQVATENGVAGLLCVAVAAVGCAGVVVAGTRRTADAAGAATWFALTTGLAMSFLHSIADFVWYVPGLAGLAVAFAAAAVRLAELERTAESPPSTPVEGAAAARAPFAAWGVAVVAACFAAATLGPPASGAFAWDRYLRASKTLRSLELKTLDPTPGGDDRFLLDTLAETNDRAIDELRQVVRRDPRNARAHARLAGRLLQRFEARTAVGANPMTLDMIGEAVRASRFPSPQATRKWLRGAFGEEADLLEAARAHSVAALRLGPTQGESYLQLASLAFLDGAPTAGLSEQAVLLRPHDGRVLFEAGRGAHLAGDVDGAFALYRRSLRLPGSHRQRLLGTLARVMAADSLIERLSPGGDAIDLVLATYRIAGDADDLAAIAAHAERLARDEAAELPPRVAAQRWRQLSAVQLSLGRAADAVACARRAYGLAADDFGVRHELALALCAAGEEAEADPHLRWCLARRPDLDYLQKALQNAARGRAQRELALRRRPVSALPELSESSPRENQETVVR